MRRAIEIVAEYKADGQPPLAEFLARRGRLEWDSENLKANNVPGVNDFTHIEYRKGWTL